MRIDYNRFQHNQLSMTLIRSTRRESTTERWHYALLSIALSSPFPLDIQRSTKQQILTPSFNARVAVLRMFSERTRLQFKHRHPCILLVYKMFPRNIRASNGLRGKDDEYCSHAKKNSIRERLKQQPGGK